MQLVLNECQFLLLKTKNILMEHLLYPCVLHEQGKNVDLEMERKGNQICVRKQDHSGT